MAIATISAVIPTKNVAEIIRPTLEALQFCDQIVIVDMYSTDGTRELCESYGNVLFLQRTDSIYANFNYGVSQASSDWVLRIDSDEVIREELRKSILGVLNDPSPRFLHYDALCHLYFFGRRLRHGFGNSRRTTIFRKGSAHYKALTEHEGLVCSGPAGNLEGYYDHFTNPTLGTWIVKTNYYLDMDASRSLRSIPLPPWKILLNTARYFRGAYWGKGKLCRDGYLGFVVAYWAAVSIALLEFKIWELHDKPADSDMPRISV